MRTKSATVRSRPPTKPTGPRLSHSPLPLASGSLDGRPSQLPFICGREEAAANLIPLRMRTHLALPTDPAESFVREVDENLRRDQARDFLKKNGPWIVGALLLFLAAVAGWLYWQDRQQKLAEAETERLNTVMGQVGAGQVATAEARLGALAKSSAESRASARLTSAAIAREINP